MRAEMRIDEKKCLRAGARQAAATLVTTAVLAAGLVAGGCRGWPESVQEKRAFGDARLQAMRQRLAGAQSVSFAADEYHLRRDPNDPSLPNAASDELAKRDLVREVALRRPDAAWFGSRGDRTERVWYAASTLTRISDDEKSWAEREVPGDLDLALSEIGERIDLLRPMTDLLSGALWDADLAPELSGGWVSIETIGKRKCDRLVYSQDRVDWQIWIEEGKSALPCQLMLVYKLEPGPARSTLVFRDWNFKPAFAAEHFLPAIPLGYERREGIEPRVAARSGTIPAE
jgi:hypothetical protein